MRNKFSHFAYDNVDQGDTIRYFDFRTGIEFVATIYHDGDYTPPDERDLGYWPSLDPQSAGYIGPKSRRTLQRHLTSAQATLEAWRNDEWRYVGIDVTAHKADVQLTPRYANAVWGIESTFPKYLREVAADLLSECRDDALGVLAKLAA